jgi:tetratricopeptide (TPR) repeat protein
MTHEDVLRRASLALNGRRPQEAEQIVREILRADPRHARALFILGAAQLTDGRIDDAIATLESAVRIKHDAEIDTMLAIALRRAGRDDDALSRLKRAVKREPAYAGAFLEFGNLLTALNRYDEAIEILNRGIAVAPMMPQLPIQLGQTFLQRRDCVSAQAAFGRALSVAPDSLEALLGLAKAHQELGDCAPAAAYFRRCLMISPDDARTLLNLGHCLLELGQIEAGYDCFRLAARGEHKRYGDALASLVKSGRGRFWLKPSAARQYLRKS